MVLKQQHYTADTFWEIALNDKRRLELIAGEIHEMAPTGHLHSRSTMGLVAKLLNIVTENNLGELTSAETGFRLSENTVLAPDIGFIQASKMLETAKDGYIPGAPDLAVEVMSPSNTAAEMSRKVDLYLQHGTSVVWIVYPKQKKIDVYEATSDGAKVTFLKSEDTLKGGNLLPNFELNLSDFFGA